MHHKTHNGLVVSVFFCNFAAIYGRTRQLTEYEKQNLITRFVVINFEENPNMQSDLFQKEQTMTSCFETYSQIEHNREQTYPTYYPKNTKLSEEKTITNKEIFDYKDKITANDSYDGDITNSITSNIDKLDFKTPGIKKIEYSVSDSAGNIATENIYVTVKKDSSDLITAGQISLIILISLC